MSEVTVPPRPRLAFLDLLRGVAILGILPVNILYFGLPVDEAAQAPSGGGAGEAIAFAVIRLLFEYKFITLFSTLFGAGLMLLRFKWQESRLGFAGPVLRRLGFLWCVGCLHALLLWYGDVLAQYAVIGLTLCWASSWSPKTLCRVGVALLGVPLVVGALLLPVVWGLELLPAVRPVLDEFMQPSGQGFAPGSTKRSWGEFFSALEHFGPALEREVFGAGTFPRMTMLRTVIWVLAAALSLAVVGWRIGGLFLLGMAWVKSGLPWDLATQRANLRRVVRWGLALGLPLELAALWIGWRTRRFSAWWADETIHSAGSLGLAAAYAGIVALWVHAERARWALGRLESLGRTAFTNYLLQSVVCTTLFYAYGGGLYGRLDRTQLWAVVLAVWTLQIAASSLWLRWFRTGPLEWVWRRFTEGVRLRA